MISAPMISQARFYDVVEDGTDVEVIDGGDRGCGELLMVLAARSRTLAPGTAVRLLSTDVAGPVELPAWCRMTGHTYLGQDVDAEGRTCYDVRLGVARTTQDARLRRLDPEPPGDHHREDHP